MKKISFGLVLFIILLLAGLIGLAYWLICYPAKLIVCSVNKQTREVTTRSPVGRIKFIAQQGNFTDIVIRKTKKYELGYRGYEADNKIEIYLTSTKEPFLQVVSVSMTTGEATPQPIPTVRISKDKKNIKISK